MRLALLLLALALPASAQAEDPTPAPTAAATKTDVDATLAKMTAAYKGVTAISGRFTQTTQGISYIEPHVQTGRISLEAPGKMRWDFESPTPTQYLSDGTTLWILEPDERKCTTFSSINEMLQLIYGFLTGSADPREHFTVTVESTEKPTVPGAIALRLTPKALEGSIESLRVNLDPTTHRVVAVSMLTPFGDRTDTVLSDVTLPGDLPDSDFVYTEREGWRTVRGD